MRRLTVSLALAAVLACMTAAGDVRGAEEMSYRLKWLFNASVIGDIYAADRGFFAQQGLAVQVKEGGPERNAIRELELGHARFGVASADQVIRAVAKGSPVVVVAQLFQVNPLHWIYRSDHLQIGRLADLKGRIIGVTFGGNDENIMQTLLAKANLSEGDVTLFSVRYDLTPFYRKQADVWPCYLNSQGVIFQQKLALANESVAFLNPADYGVKFVANSVVTSRQMLQTRPRLVKKFVAALMAAWQEAIDPVHEQEALETLAKYDRNTAADVRARQLEATRPLIQPSADIRVGRIDLDAWRQTEQIMLAQQQISRPVHVERVLQPMF